MFGTHTIFTWNKKTLMAPKALALTCSQVFVHNMYLLNKLLPCRAQELPGPLPSIQMCGSSIHQSSSVTKQGVHPPLTVCSNSCGLDLISACSPLQPCVHAFVQVLIISALFKVSLKTGGLAEIITSFFVPQTYLYRALEQQHLRTRWQQYRATGTFLLCECGPEL